MSVAFRGAVSHSFVHRQPSKSMLSLQFADLRFCFTLHSMDFAALMHRFPLGTNAAKSKAPPALTLSSKLIEIFDRYESAHIFINSISLWVIYRFFSRHMDRHIDRWRPKRNEINFIFRMRRVQRRASIAFLRVPLVLLECWSVRVSAIRFSVYGPPIFSQLAQTTSTYVPNVSSSTTVTSNVVRQAFTIFRRSCFLWHCFGP